jgi:hypothetical protein
MNCDPITSLPCAASSILELHTTTVRDKVRRETIRTLLFILYELGGGGARCASVVVAAL